MIKVISLVLVVLICELFVPKLHAGQVTMATYDFDSDYIDEIIRTDEKDGTTVIRIYKRIEDSFFYKPFQEFDVSGRLVQVPEIVDVNSDGLKDYFFATGSDMGIIYYDIPQEKFIRTNNFDFEVSWPDETQVEEAVLLKEGASSSVSEAVRKGSSIDMERKASGTAPKDSITERRDTTTKRKDSTTEGKFSTDDLFSIPKSDEGSIL